MGVIAAAWPFIYTGLCIAVIKRDFYIRERMDRERNEREKQTDWWSEWTYVEITTNTSKTTADTAVQYQYYGMAIAGIALLVFMKLSIDYMKRKIKTYEEEFDNLEDEADSARNQTIEV